MLHISMPETADERRRVLERALNVVAMIVEEKQLDPLRIVLNSDGQGAWEITIDGDLRFWMRHPAYYLRPGDGIYEISRMQASQKRCLQQALRQHDLLNDVTRSDRAASS